ncbi:MAG TPA: type II toxin-antitoxin system VapC family toxin [Myxococcales bacterium LLY-WYZ-16_1]|nr:type II toxin-antitoxin system VapC family toxin [Myxococcales bacterium LLY-WYZ-16_1]
MLLLDTHVLIWWRSDPQRLPDDLKEEVATTPVVMVSVASVWEASIKMALGRLQLPEPFSAGIRRSGFDDLTITSAHAERAADLPRHHPDPFDRLLVAQAQLEGLELVTHDPVLARYDVPVRTF